MNDQPSIEITNVLKVYDQIAVSFDSTRTQIWKSVKEFVGQLEPCDWVAEIGCGNGKNMHYMQGLKKFKHVVGCDSSGQMVGLCKTSGLDVVSGDVLNLPMSTHSMDHTMCVAVIHHLSTEEKRIQGIGELIRITKPRGLILITVWALRDDMGALSLLDKMTGAHYTEPDVMISWTILRHKFKHMPPISLLNDCEKTTNESHDTVYQRYYHLFEAQELVRLAGQCADFHRIADIREYYEMGNWNMIITLK